MTDHPDFSITVDDAGRAPSSWKWEIYRVGRNSPVKRSDGHFGTKTEADRAGRKALNSFLSEFQD
jgi:hypothetical protein